jgi:hypothetical protein
MLIAGSLLALVCGVANSAATALEKRESVRAGDGRRGLRLLGTLVRRRWWLLAMALSVLAWVSEAGALGLAPVPVVTTLRGTGRGGLVLAGHRWLGERFGRRELAGVALLAVGGILTASSVTGGSSAERPLSNLTEVAVAVAVVAVMVLLRRAHSGLLVGSGVGVAFVATGLFTKEIGDRVVREGSSAILPLLATPGPWLMVGLSLWAIALLQHAFRVANAASVSAASTAVSANGLIVASAVLYARPLATGAALGVLVTGIVTSTVGAVALAGSAPAASPPAPDPRAPAAEVG